MKPGSYDYSRREMLGITVGATFLSASAIFAEELLADTFYNKSFSLNDVVQTPNRTVGHIGPHKNTSLNLWICWTEQDAFIDAYKKTLETCKKALADDPGIHNMLKKDEWSLKERQYWEKRLCQTVSIALHMIPGLEDYRRSGKARNPSQQASNRSQTLNSLSPDIVGRTRDPKYKVQWEWDCEMQSATKGCLVQDLENMFLRTASTQNTYKKPLDYHYVVASAYLGYDDFEASLHAFILTPTGAIYEATANPCKGWFAPYLVSKTAGFSRDDFMQGKPLIAQNNFIYALTSGAVQQSLNDTIKKPKIEKIALSHQP